MVKDVIQIGRFKVGHGYTPFLIAEMSGNHNHSLDRALEIVERAAWAGAHAVKLQTYTADTMTLDSDGDGFEIKDEKSLWKGKKLYDLYKEAATPYEWHKPIMQRCQQLGMECFSSPFDPTAVDFLMNLGVPCFKVASFEMTYYPLLKKIAQTSKPIIMSTGMATEEEIRDSVNYLRENGAKEIILLKCTSTYPASPESTNIKTIPEMRNRFQTMVGLSDHTMGIGVSVASVALGAVAIEKHFTLRRADGGVDSAFSMEPEEFKSLSVESERAFLSLGGVVFGVQNENEEKSKKYRRSIYISENIKVGEVFTEKNIKCIRPALGLPTKMYEDVIGKASLTDLKKGDPLSHKDVLW